ncbi:DUF559 domain-containing protein [Nostoc sp.]|uniref:DUF559 domain-containing protein n=1 Tax=Nostoc sp. TaxID=1180 RepID=UPI002FF70340
MSVARITLAGVQIEGNLLAADITAELLAGNIKGQAPEDFGFTKTDKLADEIAIAWGDAKAYWAAFQRQLDRLDADDTATSVTRELWVVPLLRSLGYNPVYTAKAEVVEGQTYAISHRAELGENKPPIHIIGCRIKVDHRPPSGTPRLSAHALVQEYLNKTEHLWAIATNGFRWRLLRDSSLMTRLTYVEFDLEQILNGENFAEFGLFYRLFHRSRLPEGMDDADKCLLEYYHQEALQQGGRVRDRLRDGVEKALIQLGTGFLQHPSNENLRQKLAAGTELTDIGYYRQLLRLIYRLLFLMVAESRNLLIGEDVEKARIYREYYSIERLRELAERPHWRREGFQDLWQGLRVTFLLFDENWRGKYLGLSPLNGDLFGSYTLPALDDCAIDNHDLLVAIRELSLYQDKGQLRRVNYAALDVEELGSIYESLLDFHPEISPKNYEFKLVFGSERKTTGSYYTPPQLVGQLIKTALEPVIEEKLKNSLTPSPSPTGRGEQEQEQEQEQKLPFSLGEKGLGDEGKEGNENKEGKQDKWEVPLAVRRKMQEIAQQLRKQPTKSEAILWQALRNRKLDNRKFRRQHPIGTFIVDFFCQEERLIVEVDGAIHESQRYLDQQRQELLESLGLRFVRISSQQVETDLNATLEAIRAAFLPSPSRHVEKQTRNLTPQPPSLLEKGENSKPLSLQERGLERGLPQDSKSLQEQALLSLKIVDPACGSGHFLLAAARRIGKELAKIRTREAEPGSEPLKLAIRDVIQNCIYGVDINPLAVDLCKVALWIEGFSRGLPLNFLDHRIKCGNSLVGVIDLRCLNEGIPDEAFKPVTGDDKKLSTQLKKRNKNEREKKGQLSIGEKLESDSVDYAEIWRQLAVIPETTPQQVKDKQKQYKENLQESNWWLKYSACNLWTAAFFIPLTEHHLQLLPTTEALNRLKREKVEKIRKSDDNYELKITNFELSKIVDAANKLAEEKHFFHWCLEFPEVFKQGGFDCVLGNSPWEMLQLDPREFFAARSPEIAEAQNMTTRDSLIIKLKNQNPNLYTEFEKNRHYIDAYQKFVHSSSRFPLTSFGRINLAPLFTELARSIISHDGRAGVIVPSGIATDSFNQYFFADLVNQQSIASMYDFENRDRLFAAVDSRMKFCMLTMSRKPIKQGNFAFYTTQTKQLENPARLFKLSPQDIALLNPNTLTCPVFRTCADAELTKKIYHNVPVLENDKTGINPWNISFMLMFMMNTDSGIFNTEVSQGLVPLYEAKMFHHFDHRWATYSDNGDTRDLAELEKNDVSFKVQPRYWVSQNEVKNKLGEKWKKDWLLAFRLIRKWQMVTGTGFEKLGYNRRSLKGGTEK